MCAHTCWFFAMGVFDTLKTCVQRETPSRKTQSTEHTLSYWKSDTLARMHTHAPHTHTQTHTHKHMHTQIHNCERVPWWKPLTIVEVIRYHVIWGFIHTHTHTWYYQMLARELQRIDAYDQAGQSEIDKPCYYMRNGGICPVCWFLLVSLFFAPFILPRLSLFSNRPASLSSLLRRSVSLIHPTAPRSSCDWMQECVLCSCSLVSIVHTHTTPRCCIPRQKSTRCTRPECVLLFRTR